MEKLIEELELQISVMNKMNDSEYSLSDEVLDSLYSVYPFNKFEYINFNSDSDKFSAIDLICLTIIFYQGMIRTLKSCGYLRSPFA